MSKRTTWAIAPILLVSTSCGDGHVVSPTCDPACAAGTLCEEATMVCLPVCVDPSTCPDGGPPGLDLGPGHRHTVPVEGLLLTAADSPHVFFYDVFVPAGRALTIEAGARIEMAIGRSIHVDGSLDAQGTATDPITITAAEGGRWGSLNLSKSATASQLEHTQLSEGSVSVRAGLDATTGLTMTNAWLNVANVDAFTLVDSTFASTDPGVGYTAFAALDVGTLIVGRTQFSDIPGTAVYVRNASRSHASSSIASVTVRDPLGSGLHVQTQQSAVVALDGNYITGASGVGIFAQGVGGGLLELNARGNHAVNGGSYGLLVDADGELKVEIDELAPASASAAPAGDLRSRFSDNTSPGLRVAGRRGGAVTLRHITANNITSDGVQVDIAGAPSRLNASDISVRNMMGSGFSASFRDGAATVNADNIDIDGVGAIGEGIRFLAYGGGTINLSSSTVTGTDGRCVNLHLGENGMVDLAGVSASECGGDGVRVFSHESLSSAAFRDVTVSDAAGTGLFVEGREGLNLTVGRQGAASVGLSVSDIGGNGLYAVSRGALLADVSDIAAQRTEGRGVYLTSRTDLDAAIYDVSVSDTVSYGIQTDAWGHNATIIGESRTATPGAVTGLNTWAAAVMINAQDSVNATVRNLVATGGNSHGLAIQQYQEVSSGGGLRADVDGVQLSGFRQSGIYVTAEAPAQATAPTLSAISVADSVVFDVSDYGVHITGRSDLRDVDVRNNVVGDGIPTLMDGTDDTSDCDAVASPTVGLRGIYVASWRGRAGPRIEGNQICNTDHDGIHVYSANDAELALNEPAAAVTITNNTVESVENWGLIAYGHEATLSGNIVESSGGGLLHRSSNLGGINLTVLADQYLRNRWQGINLGQYSWAVIDGVRGNENGSHGLLLSSDTYAEITGSQFMANEHGGIWHSGAYDYASWSAISDTCVGANGSYGIYYSHDTWLPQTLAPRIGPEVLRSCVFDNALRGINGIGPDESGEHWWATDVKECNVSGNGEYGVVRGNGAIDSWINGNHFDDPANASADGGTCIANGMPRNGSSNHYVISSTDSSRNVSGLGCITGARASPVDFRASPYDWPTNASIVGCIPDPASPRSDYGAPAECP